MSEYGLKIKNYQAGSIYEVNTGVRNNYDCKDAMFTNSLFSDYMKAHGLDSYKGESTRDIICLEFKYGSRSFDDELKHVKKLGRDDRIERKLAYASKDKKRIIAAKNRKRRISDLYLNVISNENKFDKRTSAEIREIYYRDGVDIRYPIYKRKKIIDFETVHYRMLYRSAGKAKKGTCMFIRDSLYETAHHFLWMGLSLPDHNAPIVEIGAYSSLSASTIEGYVTIKPEEILVLNDVDSSMITDVISVETNDRKECLSIRKDGYKVKNTMFDGQALIDDSVFPDWGEGYLLLRQHFTKCAAFRTYIQKYFSDYYGDRYHDAYIDDYWGRPVKVDKIKLITTDNALKWLKFDVDFDYWSEWVELNGSNWGIVKTAHPSKLGVGVQRTSYQMINALSIESMDSVLSISKNYIEKLKTDTDTFLDYLRKNSNFSNDYEVLLALVEHNPYFIRSSYFRYRRDAIISSYVLDLKNGRTLQNADNLVIVGSPYAMLLHAVGENPLSDPTFECESDAIQCFTERFDDGEYLAEFRSPFNSRNNLGHLHNHYHPYLKEYFNLGKLIIAVNMNGTCFQDRNNGSDQDSDSIYTTNQSEIVSHARYCYLNYPTIVNNIPKEKNIYSNDIKNFSTIDSNLAASQTDIGESSNLAQVCLSYTYNFDDEKYGNYVCILSVLAQVAIDSAKRRFDVNVSDEIKRIKKDINIRENKYPPFWLAIRKGFNKNNINWNLKCPMNEIYNVSLRSARSREKVISIDNFFIKHEIQSKKIAKKVQSIIETYSLELLKKDSDDRTEFLLLRADFDKMIEDIRATTLPDKYVFLISFLIDKAFKCTPQMKRRGKKSRLEKNKSLLLKTLYDVNNTAFLACFKDPSELEKTMNLAQTRDN